jgi:hypothetical protein
VEIEVLIIPADRIYMIRRKDMTDPRFFLLDTITQDEFTLPIAYWTPVMLDAREFYTEESVETYLYEKLKHRPCEIIMVK